MEDEAPDYSPAWSDLNKRIALFGLCFIAGFIVVGIFGVLTNGAGILLFFPWIVGQIVTGTRWSMFPCPRCAKHFFRPSAWSVNQLLSACPHCGLERP